VKEGHLEVFPLLLRVFLFLFFRKKQSTRQIKNRKRNKNNIEEKIARTRDKREKKREQKRQDEK